MLALASIGVQAKQTIRVNNDVTTHLVLPENIKLVDISTTRLLGNQCADNIVRLKPSLDDPETAGEYYEDESMGTVTVICERHIIQYDVVYVGNRSDATSIYNVSYEEMTDYQNPEVSMPSAEMARYAWAIYTSPRKSHRVIGKNHGMTAILNNIYTIGNYFFIDYTLENKTSIPYEIDEVRVKLTDKKEVKATNSQTIELEPVFSLNEATSFKKNYRNVLVLDKLTFPEEKILQLEISESQISGRVLTLKIKYNDILSADGIDESVMSNLKR